MRGISRFALVQILMLTAAVMVCAHLAHAINVKIDYTYDTNNFFPADSQARAALEKAASDYSRILEDTFDEIDVPTKFFGSRGGEATWFWKRRFLNPTTGFNEAQINAEINANEYVVFVGSRDLVVPGELALAGPGGFAVRGNVSMHGEFTAAERAEIEAIDATFVNAVTDRGETSGFGRWGGSIAFDSAAAWHFNHTTAPGAGLHDLYTVALHELAHTFGFGEEDGDTQKKTAWENLVSTSGGNATFTGSNVNSAYSPAANAPLESVEETSHWGAGIGVSAIYEGSGNQAPLMLPEIPSAQRRLLTAIDVAALVDLGWSIDLPGGSASAASIATLSSVSHSSAATSVAALSASGVPEPSSLLLLALASGMLTLGARRSR